jgi:hypothetical protein
MQQEYSKQEIFVQQNTFHKHADTIWSQLVMPDN